MMKQNILSLLVAFCGLVIFSSNGIANTASDQAIAVAENFAALIDSGSFQAAYLSGSAFLREANDELDWIGEVERSRKLPGEVRQRKLRKTRFVSTFPRMPDGEYLLAYFETQTERKNQATEVILIALQENAGEVCYYVIR